MTTTEQPVMTGTPLRGTTCWMCGQFIILRNDCWRTYSGGRCPPPPPSPAHVQYQLAGLGLDPLRMRNHDSFCRCQTWLEHSPSFRRDP